MLVNLLRRPNCVSQALRKCQTKCAINPENVLEDAVNGLNVGSQNVDQNVDQTLNRNSDQTLNQNADQTLNHKASFDAQDERTDGKRSLRGNKLFFPRPLKNTEERSIKDVLRVQRYGQAMGLPVDMPFDEAAKAVNEHFDQIKPGLRFFEKTGCPIYGSNFNSLLWYRAAENRIWYKYIAAELFEKNIIFDFSYDSFMNQNEKNSLVYQVIICLGLNRRSRLPFPILLANVDRSSYTFRKLDQHYLNGNRAGSMIKITDQSYLDVLPREQIVYLSPHAEESLTEFRPDYHYVIGCFVDISFSKQLSYKKAQAEGVKCYKLPIDEFVAYSKIRNKLLPLPIVHQILLDKKERLDWKETLECNLGKNRLQIQMDELDAFERKYKHVKKHLYAK